MMINNDWDKEFRVKLPEEVHQALQKQGASAAAAFKSKNVAAAMAAMILCEWYEETHRKAAKKRTLKRVVSRPGVCPDNKFAGLADQPNGAVS